MNDGQLSTNHILCAKTFNDFGEVLAFFSKLFEKFKFFELAS